MSAPAFDTLKLSRRLEAAGFTREQSAGVAEALGDTIGGALVTQDYLDARLAHLEAGLKAELKADIAAVRTKISGVETELKADIARIEAELKADIARIETDIRAVEHRLTIKLGVMMVVAVGAVATLVKLL